MDKKNKKVLLLVVASLVILLSSFYYNDDDTIKVNRSDVDSIILKRDTAILDEEIFEIFDVPPTFEEFMKDSVYKDLRDSLYLDSKIFVESRGEATIRNGNQVGILQITPAAIRECNNILKLHEIGKRYTLKDRLNPLKSKEIHEIIMEEYNPSSDLFESSCIWNAGGNSKHINKNAYKKVKIYHSKIIKRMQFLYKELCDNNK